MRTAWRRWIVGLGIVALPVALRCTTPATTYTCNSAAQCVNGNAVGTCEPTGFCSFTDSACASGWRYGTYAGSGLGGTCVVCGQSGEACCGSTKACTGGMGC